MPVSWDQFVESLTTSNVSALIPKLVDPALLDYYRRFTPLSAALPEKTWNTNTYYFNQWTSIPTPQSIVEAPATSGTGSVSATSSTWTQKSFTIAHIHSQGSVGRFAQRVVSQTVADLLMFEMKSHTKALRFYEDVLHIWGDSAATPSASNYRPQWDGIATQIDSSTRQLATAGQAGSLALSDLDNLIDAVVANIAGNLPDDDYFFLISPKMFSRIAQLHNSEQRHMLPVRLAPRRDDGTVGGDVVQIDSAGVEVLSYRGIPFVRHSFLTPRNTMSTVTATAGGSDGSMSNTGANYYAVEAVFQQGVTVYATANATPTASQHIDLTFAAPTITDAEGNTLPPLLYRVYKGTSSGAANLSLYGVVAAKSASDNPVLDIRDTGTAITAGEASLANPVTGHFVGTDSTIGDKATFPHSTSSVEDIFLATRNPDYLCVPTVTGLESKILAITNAHNVDFAVYGDKCLAMRAPRYAGMISSVKTN